jgi:bifunctional UDP-N-acetylglucosamine pyrophosphorylase/glucosamine-1-phosphate N-acetyltransferase
LKAIILAAGAGKRMKSDLPKVMHTMAGKPMLHHVIDTCLAADVSDITIVVGIGGGEVQKNTPYPVNFVRQNEQMGTGHAVMCAREHISPEDRVLVLYGDMPLVTPGLLKELSDFQLNEKSHGVVVAARVPEPTGYGRVIVDSSGLFTAIVEERDLAPGQHKIDYINTGVYLFTGRELIYGLGHMDNNNSQREYYLTDVPKIMIENGRKVAVLQSNDHLQFLGVNSQKQLAEAAAALRRRIIDSHFENGVVMTDPSTVYIDADVEIEAGAVILPGVMLHGECKISAAAVIGPNTQITDSRIGPGTVIRNSVAEDAVVGANCQIGPFAYLRKGTVAGDNCRIGDFVEIKNATLGDGAKASHLAYIGDAKIGANVNYGCGAITCNYDGNEKHLTVVEDGAFVGSNVNLIAPVVVGAGAFVAAGSTIVQEVPGDAFAIARQRQVNKEDGAKKYKK